MTAVCKEAEARMECNKSERSRVSKTGSRSSSDEYIIEETILFKGLSCYLCN